MSSFLIFSNKTKTTGKKIAKSLGIFYGEDTKDRYDFLIRWGSSAKIKVRSKETINSRAAILLASNKLLTIRRLQEANIRVPNFMPLREETILHIQFPVLARKKIHQQGKDIILCLQTKDAKDALKSGHDYVVSYIPTSAEYRVHVFRGEILKVSQKILTHKDKYTPWIRNFEHGFTYRNPDKQPNEVRRISKEAIKILDLDFGAVDVIVSDSGSPYILEINTGPGLIARSIKKYATALAKITNGTLNKTYLEGLINAENPEEAEAGD